MFLKEVMCVALDAGVCTSPRCALSFKSVCDHCALALKWEQAFCIAWGSVTHSSRDCLTAVWGKGSQNLHTLGKRKKGGEVGIQEIRQ